MTTKQLLKKMMSFRPVSEDKAAVNRLVDFVGGYLKDKRVFTKVERLDGRKVLYASTSRGKKSPLLFNAHLDVVPADEDTFCWREKRGWIFGRGAGDCLGNCAVLVHLLSRTAGRVDIGVVFSTDEETGGETTAHMIDRGYSGDFVILLDGGGYRIAVAQKGVLTVRLEASGRACHGSTPWRGVNAVDRLIDGYSRVKKLFPAVGPGNEWHTTMSANVIRGGTVFNRVPDRAEMLLDIRYTKKPPVRDLVKRIRQVSGLKAVIVRKQPMVFCNEKHPRVKQLGQLMRRRLRKEIRMVRMNGATDARHFTKLKVPMAIIGIPARGAHSRTECVSVSGMKQYEEMLYEYIIEKS